MHPLVTQRLDDVDEVVFVVSINAFHAGVIVRHAIAGKHLHAFPLELLLRIRWSHFQDKAVEGLPCPRALQRLDPPDSRNIAKEILIERTGAIRTDNFVVAHQDHGEVGGVVRDRLCNGVHHVRVDRRHGRIDDFDLSRRQRSSELGRQEPIKAVVFVGKTEGCRTTEDIDPDHLRTALYGKGVFPRGDIQRRGIKLVSKIGVFLVVSLTLDIDLMEEVERRSDTKDREAQLQQDEEEQGDYENRNECKDNFFDEMASRRRRMDSNG